MGVSPPFARLAQELVDEIIDYLAESTATLFSCSLVSTKFLPRSQYHLFHTVSFASIKPELLFEINQADQFSLLMKRIMLFLEIITKRPIITTYIRTLVISFHSQVESWIYTDYSFLKIMERLAVLDTLYIRSHYDSGEHSLTEVEAFMNNFWTPFITQNITTLIVQSWTQYPPAIFVTCPKLSHLQLYHLPEFSSDAARAIGGARLTVPLRLEMLSFADSGTCLNALSSLRLQDGTPFLDLSGLKRLDCASTPRRLFSIIWVHKALVHTAPTLQELRLHLDYCIPEQDGNLQISLDGCTRLQSLHFHLSGFENECRGSSSEEEPFLPLAHVISTAHKLHTIHYLSFTTGVVVFDDHDSLEFDPASVQHRLLDDWRIVDDAIFHLSNTTGETITVEFNITLDLESPVSSCPMILNNLGTYCLPRTNSDASFRIECNYSM